MKRGTGKRKRLTLKIWKGEIVRKSNIGKEEVESSVEVSKVNAFSSRI